jgi:uncharacterized protein (DUF1330 family)
MHATMRVGWADVTNPIIQAVELRQAQTSPLLCKYPKRRSMGRIMYEYLVGLQVTNDELYGQYRNAMLPILTDHGGGFGYDFKVAEVLINQSGISMNRVFTIRFPDEATAKAFFSNSQYLAAKEQYFEKAVEHTTIIAQYAT